VTTLKTAAKETSVERVFESLKGTPADGGIRFPPGSFFLEGRPAAHIKRKSLHFSLCFSIYIAGFSFAGFKR